MRQCCMGEVKVKGHCIIRSATANASCGLREGWAGEGTSSVHIHTNSPRIIITPEIRHPRCPRKPPKDPNDDKWYQKATKSLRASYQEMCTQS